MNETMSEFERGVRAGVNALQGYFRNEDDKLTIDLTEAEMESYCEGAIANEMYDESLRIERGSADSEVPDDAAGARPDIAADEDPFFDNDPDSRMGF